MDQLLKLVTRKSDVDFLEKERAHEEAHVVGQSTISMWSALEVFVGDVLVAVLTRDRSLFKKVNEKHKVAIADFYALDDDERIARVINLVKEDSKLSPGLGAFEPLFKAFDLGGSVHDATRRTILEFAAVRNCLVHRKGIVDEKFLEACGTTKLKLGDAIRLTQAKASSYFFAANQYAASISDRVSKRYLPAWEPSQAAAKMLEFLEEALTKHNAAL